MRADVEHEKVPIHSRIAADVALRARSAVYYTPGLTLDKLVEVALQKVLKQLERSRGEKFPGKALKLRAGRPVKL